MTPLELAAYPALLAAFYGAYRVGRRRPSDRAFEWARVCVLAILLGVLIAVQWRMVASGIVRSEAGLFAGFVGIAGTVALVGLHMYEVIEAKDAPASADPTQG